MLHFHSNRPLIVGWLAGLVTAGIIAGVIGLLAFTGITFDTSASTPHPKLVGRAMHQTMVNSVRRRSGGLEPPEAAARASMLRGAIAYQRDCTVCHGGPGYARARWVSAMQPTPPYLLDTPNRWTHAELYKVIRDGVKMSGMPAWREVESPQTISDLTLFVERLPKVSPQQFARINQATR